MNRVIILPLCFEGMTSQQKPRKRWALQNLPPIPFLSYHDTQNTKTRKEAIFCPRATNTEHNIANNTRTRDNTGINIEQIVSIKPLDILSIRTYFRSRSNEFKAGKLKHYFDVWRELSSKKEILQTVLGLKLELWVTHQ